jgi:N-carbamoyl-L-amino-acid hydrolase
MLTELARIGADPEGGITRLGLSPAENQARGYLTECCRLAGATAQIDQAGNLLVRRPGPARGHPALLIGSHIDSVVRGGWLDGAYGVVAALEVVFTLAAHGGDFPWEPVAVGFANEEGSLVQYPFWGSSALTGALVQPLDACDRAGRQVASYLAEAGGDPIRLAHAAWAPGSIGGYLELHIEQGPVLERRHTAIGVVDTISGRSVVEITITGKPGHAGTTPMTEREDALAAAAELILDVESISKRLGICATSTVGYITAEPNTTNVIPGAVCLTAELRDGDPDRITAGQAQLHEMARAVGTRRGVAVTVTTAHRYEPAVTDPRLRASITAAASELGLDYLVMPSGAGHDAQILASIAPIGMIFVPSIGGISHQPSEDTPLPALIAGAEVLLQAALNVMDNVAPTAS